MTKIIVHQPDTYTIYAHDVQVYLDEDGDLNIDMPGFEDCGIAVSVDLATKLAMAILEVAYERP